MKNKKKLISKIVILLMVSVICLLGVLFTVKSKMKTKEKIADATTDNTIQEKTDENVIDSTNEQLEDSINMEVAEAVTEETEEQLQVADNQQKETSQVNTVKSNKSKTATTTKNQTQKSNPVQSQKQQTPQQSVASTPQKQTTTTQAQTQNIKTEGEKFVRNDTMINRIKSVINNNPSDNMKTHGYTIQVDPSIKTKTNQFTFAESRVINFIKYSFGTIRVYAEDYYNNGQFIMTECYIF